jgi:hypothetical protein
MSLEERTRMLRGWNFNIALALNRQGKRQEAEPFLSRAAENADPQVRKAAQDLLGARK